MAVVIVNSYTTQAIVYLVNDLVEGKQKLEHEYCNYIKECRTSYLADDSTYAMIETYRGIVEIMLSETK